MLCYYLPYTSPCLAKFATDCVCQSYALVLDLDTGE